MEEKKLSLVFELDVLRQVLLSARLVAELLANDGMPDTHSRAQAPRMLEAVLALAAARVRLLSLVVQEEVDASVLVGPENRSAGGADADVVFPQGKRRRRAGSGKEEARNSMR